MKKIIYFLMSLIIAIPLIVLASDIVNWSSTVNGTAKITTDESGTATLVVDAAQIGSGSGILKATSGTISTATAGTDYLAPNTATFTNSANTAVTNLVIKVNKGLITSITINGVTKP